MLRRPGPAGRALPLLPALVIALAAAGVCLARADSTRFTEPAELPAAGIRLRVPPDLAQTPVPSPATRTYLVKDASGTRTVECLSPGELWRQSQIECMWSDAKGIAMVVATIRTSMPSFPQHLPRDEATAAAARATAPANWNAETLLKWAQDFAGQTVASMVQAQKPPAGLKQAWMLTFGDGNACAAIFKPYQSASVRRVESPNYLFAWMRLPPGGDAVALSTVMRDDFLPTIAANKSSVDAAPEPDTRFRNRRVWDKATASAELEESRRRVADSIRNLRDWWYADTPHYVLLSNLPSRNRQVVREMQARTERFRALFEEVMPPPEPSTAVSVIRVFATDDEYNAYVGPDYRWTTGMWVSSRRELVSRPVRAEFRRDENDRFLSVIAHEAYHQYVSASMEPAVPAPWFNEGHAELFAQSTLDRDRLVVAESPVHTPVMERMAKSRAFDAGRLMGMSYSQFYSGNQETVAANYAMAWGLVYFLHKSAGQDQKSPFRNILPLYRRELTATQEGKPPRHSVTAGIDNETLNRDMAAFWSSNSKRQAAKRAPLLVCLP